MLLSVNFPLLTARLRLRPVRVDDLEALSEIYLHPRVAPWTGLRTREEVKRELSLQREHQATLGFSCWVLERRSTRRVIGDCGLQPLEHRGPEIEVGYNLHPSVWGQGLASEAARAVLDVAFGRLGIGRVVAVVSPENPASQRVLEKAGLTRTGIRHAYGASLLLYETDDRCR
jgi:RimJ/RimL family protein N-acetyltransferase